MILQYRVPVESNGNVFHHLIYIKSNDYLVTYEKMHKFLKTSDDIIFQRALKTIEHTKKIPELFEDTSAATNFVMLPGIEKPVPFDVRIVKVHELPGD